MTRIAAITHARHDDFFLEIWVCHYSKLVGAENCFVILDGDDWKSEVDLSGVNVAINTTRFYRRIKHDAHLANTKNARITELLGDYDYCINTDCDEMVCVDPSSGKSLQEAVAEAGDNPILNSRGVEIVHNYEAEPAFDPALPILQQRRHAVIYSLYFKPNVIAKPASIRAGGHGARDATFRLSASLILFHLANLDRDRLEQRITAREGTTFKETTVSRLDYFAPVRNGVAPLDYDEVMADVSQRLGGGETTDNYVAPGFRDGNVRLHRWRTGFYVKLPDRFRLIVL
ncbi:MAG: glycosyltransferase family 2 protein [Pseudomonadota bacterium]